MYEKLAAHRAAMKGPPVLMRTGGVSVAVTDDHTTLFASDADCLFFVEAYAVVPSLIATIEEQQAKLADLGDGALKLSREEINLLSDETAKQRARITELEKQIEAEVKLRTSYEKRIRAGALVAQKARGMVEQITTLQREVEIAREEAREAKSLATEARFAAKWGS